MDYLALAEQIDTCDHEVTTWEANFLDTLLTQRPTYLSERQKAIIDRMATQYLHLRPGKESHA